MAEDDFETPVAERKDQRKAKSSLVGSLLQKDGPLNHKFDDLKTGIRAASPDIPKRCRRRHGRPAGGRVHFEQLRIDALPEYGRVSEYAKALGIRDASLLQWVELKQNPLPCVEDRNTGYKVFRKDIVVAWLESTGRYKAKPEYDEKE